MSLTEEQKEIIKSSIEDFDMKFFKIKIKFLNMGYKQNDAEDLAWAFFIMVNANVTPGEYDFYYKEICKKMNDINIIIKDAFGREIKTNTGQIEEDILRMRIGLEPQEQDGV